MIRTVCYSEILLMFALGISCANKQKSSKEMVQTKAPKAARQTTAPAPGTRVILLGTGTPNADPRRSGPAVAVVAGQTPYLFDCGPGVVRRAEAAYEKGQRALAMENLSRVFITHLHSDHTVGLPDLMLTPWVLGRRSPLQVYGPPGIQQSETQAVGALSSVDVGLHPAATPGREQELV